MDNKYLEYLKIMELEANFTLEELKKKWKELALEYHPDRHVNSSERMRKLAEEQYKKINEAYDYLMKNYGKNENTSNNNNYKEEESYSNENNRKRSSVIFYMTKNEALEYFSIYLADLKKKIKDRFQPLATKIFEDYSEQLSGKFDHEPLFDEIISLKDMTEEFFAKNLLKFNAIKESDEIFLQKNIIKVNTLIKKIDREIGESTFDYLFERYQNKNFALLGAYRHYSFIEKIKEWMMEIYYCVDKHFKNIDSANNTIRYSRGFTETIFNLGLGSLKKFNSNNSLKENLEYLFNDYSNRVFNIFVSLIYLGYREDELSTQITRLENYRRMKTEPEFYLENCNPLNEEYIEMFFRFFPNEKNNILLELYLALNHKNMNEIQNISTKIQNIEYNKSFEIIVNRLFPKYKDKKKSFFVNIQLLLNENSRKVIIFALKNVKENLEKNENYYFWGSKGENNDLKKLCEEYYFLDNSKLYNFIEESDEYLKDIFSYKKNLLKEKENIRVSENNQKIKEVKNKLLYLIIPMFLFIILGGALLYKQFANKNEYVTVYYSQPKKEEVKENQNVVENKNVNKYVPTAQDAKYIKYNNYYNNNYDYSMDYPDDDYFKISANYENGMEMRNEK